MVSQNRTLIRRPEVLRRVGIKTTTLYRLMSAGHFPRPVKIGVAAVAWVEDEVDEWIASRISERETTKCGTTIIYDWNKD